MISNTTNRYAACYKNQPCRQPANQYNLTIKQYFVIRAASGFTVSDSARGYNVPGWTRPEYTMDAKDWSSQRKAEFRDNWFTIGSH